MPTAIPSTPWVLKSPPSGSILTTAQIQTFAAQLDISPLLVRLLHLRGQNSLSEMNKFLSPGLRNLPPLDSWPAVQHGAQIIAGALAEGAPIAIWGDYDVDGITATSLAKDFLAQRGIQATHYIPDRLTTGYGLHPQGIQDLATQGVRLLVTVDCGISNTQEVRIAKNLGMTVVITDHHLPGKELPAADAIINPKIGTWPSHDLSGVGVSFLLMAALNHLLPGPRLDIRAYLDLVALGTIADVVPLDAQNRILVKNGLLLIKDGCRTGIRALKDISGLPPGESIGAGAIGFALAPRINAAGRIGDPNLAVQLLLEKDPAAARDCARQLDQLNAKRKTEEQRILEEAVIQAETQIHLPGFVLHSEHWHSGIIGIVASRIVDRYQRPCLILTKENGIFKGSGRGIPEFDLHAALTACKECLYTYGGHRQAAGVKLEPFHLTKFKKMFADAVTEQLGTMPAPPPLALDMELPFQHITDILLSELELLQPFGQGNSRPAFLSPPLTVFKQRFFGAQKHLELFLTDTTSGATFRGVAWRQGALWKSQPLEKRKILIAYTPKLSRFNNIPQIELTVHGILSVA